MARPRLIFAAAPAGVSAEASSASRSGEEEKLAVTQLGPPRHSLLNCAPARRGGEIYPIIGKKDVKNW